MKILTSFWPAVAVYIVGIITAAKETKPSVVSIDKTVGTLLEETLISVAVVEQVAGGFMGSSLSSGLAGVLTN